MAVVTTTIGEWGLAGAAALTLARRELSKQLEQELCPLDADNAECLLLAFEELASNGVRHGGGPVTVRVTCGPAGWLVDVVDTATDRPPRVAVDRDPADGGMGLRLVASLCAEHGLTVHAGRKHVWACLLSADYALDETGATRT